MTGHGSPVNAAAFLLVERVEIHPGFNKELDDLIVALEGGVVQRISSVFVLNAGVGKISSYHIKQKISNIF